MRLLEPVRVGPYKLPNRIVMASLMRSRAGGGNAPTELNALYDRRRSSAGFIISEAPHAIGYAHTPR